MQVALPIMVTFAIATWYQSKRVDALRSDMNRRFDDVNRDMNHRFDELIKRLDGIEGLLQNHDQRITRLEERTSPVRK